MRKVSIWKINRVCCSECGDIIEYIHETQESNPGHLVTCKCGDTSIDPCAYAMYRVIYKNPNNPPEDLSVLWEDYEKGMECKNENSY